MSSDNYAAIDCGTNSTRLLIGNKLETFDRQMRITRLGQDVAKTGELSGEAMSRVLEALGDFRKRFENHGAVSYTHLTLPTN